MATVSCCDCRAASAREVTEVMWNQGLIWQIQLRHEHLMPALEALCRGTRCSEGYDVLSRGRHLKQVSLPRTEAI